MIGAVHLMCVINPHQQRSLILSHTFKWFSWQQSLQIEIETSQFNSPHHDWHYQWGFIVPHFNLITFI